MTFVHTGLHLDSVTVMTVGRKLKPHKKTRSGCLQCKSRHRKCDELHPSCNNCQTAGLRCGFADLTASLPLTYSGPAPQVQLNKEVNEPDLVFSLRDMELLHHFTVSTSLTLWKDRSLQRFHQCDLPQLGLRNPFLLHSVLSLSALHLAQTAPYQQQRLEYHSDAAKHHDKALTKYQQELQDPRPERYDAIFMSASLLFNFVFAYANGEPSDVLCEQQHAVEIFLSFRWVHVARGIRMLRKRGEQWLQSAPLWSAIGKTMINWPVMRDPITNENIYDFDPPSPQEKDLASLESMWIGDRSIHDEHGQLYSDALKSLVRAYRRSHQRRSTIHGRHVDEGNQEFVQSMGWLVELSEPFIGLLEQHDPRALVLMCHYTKLLDTISFSFWWTHQNSQICTARIKRILPLEWHRWLRFN